MKSLLSIPVLLLLLAGASATLSDVRLSYFKVEKEVNSLVVSWQAELEDEVREYELLRRTQASREQFVKVQAFPAHGVEKPYRYVDDQLYKAAASEQVDYQLVAVYLDGTRKELASKSINYTSTALRRTWGSIKAMFQ